MWQACQGHATLLHSISLFRPASSWCTATCSYHVQPVLPPTPATPATFPLHHKYLVDMKFTGVTYNIGKWKMLAKRGLLTRLDPPERIASPLTRSQCAHAHQKSVRMRLHLYTFKYALSYL